VPKPTNWGFVDFYTLVQKLHDTKIWILHDNLGLKLCIHYFVHTCWLLPHQLLPPEEFIIYDFVTDFLKGLSNLAKLVEMPFPFPLVQMTCTFLFVWIFALPFVLCQDTNTYPVDPLIMVFLTTFGFIGLEYVAQYGTC
jgi:hypothetical protein